MKCRTTICSTKLKGRRIMPFMNSRKAFWKAVAMAAIPAIFIWSILLSFTHFRSDEWPIYAISVAFTLLILVPILYYRYRKGESLGDMSNRTPAQYNRAGIIFTVLGIGY